MPAFLPLLLLFLLSPGPGLSSDCPADCSCLVQDSIFCIQRRSTAVPRGLPDTTVQLYVFQNGIDTLTQEDFTGLGELEMLDLSQNELTVIPDAVFETLSKLRNLDLSSNHITHISKDSFAGLVQLERLYLHANSIQSIHPEAFEGLEMLLELKLQGNQISYLPPLHLPRLLLLDLSYNSLPVLGASDLQTPHLESLKLAALQLTSLDVDLMTSLGNLQDLDISQNQLVELPQALRQGALKGLIKLSLAANPLGELKAEDFQKLVGLQELDLSGLNLQRFPQDFFQTFPRLWHLTAAENPFNCLCPLAWVPVWLKDSNVNLGRSEETRCHFPPVNAGKMLAELEHQDFGCPPTTTTLSSSHGEESTPAPPLPTTSPETTHTNAIPPPPPSEEPPSSKTDSHPLPPEPAASPSSTSMEYEERICPPNICLNGGTCGFDPMGQLGCLCPPATSGLYCENVGDDHEPRQPSVTEDSVITPVMTSEPDAISSRQVTSTSILLDLHRFIETRPHIRGIRLTFRNLSGPDRRPMFLSVPASYPEYTLRGLRPNSTYSVCANPLGERVNARINGTGEVGSCTEARTTGVQATSPEPRVLSSGGRWVGAHSATSGEPPLVLRPNQLTYTLIPALGVLALVLGVAVVAGAVVCLRRRKQAKADMGLELGPAEPDPRELEGVKACLENGGNGTLPHKQGEIDHCHTPQLPPSLQQNGGLEYEVPLMQGHCPSNNNVAALKPSYF